MFMQGLVRATYKVCSGIVGGGGGGGGADNTEYSRHLGKKITYADRYFTLPYHQNQLSDNENVLLVYTNMAFFLSCSLACSTHFKISLHGLLKDMSMLKDLYAN